MSEIPYHAYDKTGTFKPPGYSDGLTKINHVTKTDPGEITRVEVPNPTPPADSLNDDHWIKETRCPACCGETLFVGKKLG
jgi:hypothetical protein